jgi:hypothetical protein
MLIAAGATKALPEVGELSVTDVGVGVGVGDVVGGGVVGVVVGALTVIETLDVARVPVLSVAMAKSV